MRGEYELALGLWIDPVLSELSAIKWTLMARLFWVFGIQFSLVLFLLRRIMENV